MGLVFMSPMLQPLLSGAVSVSRFPFHFYANLITDEKEFEIYVLGYTTLRECLFSAFYISLL